MRTVIVCGPPCAGKSTYARSHAEPGDRVVDFDDIVQELGGERYSPSHQVMEQARQTWWDRATTRHPTGTSWVIWAAPKRWQRAHWRKHYRAEIVLVTASPEICLQRARETRPQRFQALVTQWFRTWEPSTSVPETVVET